MSINHLSQAEVAIIGECLTAASSGPFLRQGQFFDEEVLGFNLDELLDVSSKWPQVVLDSKLNRVVNNVLAAFMPDGYPLYKGEDWSKWISASPAEVDAILAKWRRRDCPLSEEEAIEIATKYAFNNEINNAEHKIEKKPVANFKVSTVYVKSWGWVFRLEPASDFLRPVVIVNKHDGFHFACSDSAANHAANYEKTLSTWELR